MGQKLVTNRDITISSTSGCSIAFVKGEPVYVPDHFISECLAVGAIPVDGEEVKLATPKHKNTPAPEGEDRKQQILDAIDTMVILNTRGTFNANGLPKQKTLENTAGFVIDTREIEPLWRAYDTARKSDTQVDIPQTVADPAPEVNETPEVEEKPEKETSKKEAPKKKSAGKKDK